MAYNPSFGVDVQGQLWVAGSYASSGQPQVAAWQIARDGEQLTVSEPRILNSVLGEEQLSYNAFTISPDATYVAAGYGDDLSASPAIQIWSLKRDTKPLVVYGHQERINDLTFSPDGRVLVTASGYTSEFHPGEDNGVRLWRVERNPTRLTELARFMTELQADDVAFSPNGRLVVGNDYRGDLVVWDTVTGDEVAKLSGRFYSVTFAPDNSLLVAGDAYGGIHLFDTHSWQEVKVLYGHIGGIDYLAFDPQGEVLASSGNDGTMRLWGVSR
ncbi:MAG: hypothetical protein R3E39_23125 [Anaerolineae bacterium]